MDYFICLKDLDILSSKKTKLFQPEALHLLFNDTYLYRHYLTNTSGDSHKDSTLVTEYLSPPLKYSRR